MNHRAWGHHTDAAVSLGYHGSAWDTANPVSDTIYVNHSMQCLEELDNLNSDLPVRAYAWGQDVAGRLDLADSPFMSMAGAGGVGGLLCMVTAESGKVGTYQMTYDGNGNIVKLLNASGAQMVLYRYGPFGEDLLNVPHYVYNPFRFSTKFHETALAGNSTAPPELYDYGFRWYHADLGRWTARDPIGELGGVNPYTFSEHDPLGSVDIHGLIREYYDDTGLLLYVDRTWWPFGTTKYIEDPMGSQKSPCPACTGFTRVTEVWEYDEEFLTGAPIYTGLNSNWDANMKAFVETHDCDYCWMINIRIPPFVLLDKILKEIPCVGGHPGAWNFNAFTWSIPIVLKNSPSNKPWDYKRTLSRTQWYVFNDKAYLRDSCGNITWAGIMKSYNWPETFAKKGAGAFHTYEHFDPKELDSYVNFFTNLCNAGDDIRDSAAIEVGYDYGW